MTAGTAAGLDAVTLGPWARGELALELRADQSDLDRVREGQRRLEAAREVGVVYGLTTGVGALRSTEVRPGEGSEAALRLWRSHAAGLGPELDDATARAVMAVRWRQLLDGTSGVGPDLVLALEQAIRSGCVPRLHAYGALGSGDLTVLAELALTLCGELPWRTRGDGAPPPVLPAGADGLPFLSSNAVTASVSALAVDRLTGLAAVALEVAGLSHLALRGSVEAYDEAVFAGRPGAAADAASRLRDLLAGDRPPPARVQDPFCLRTVPQTHGPLIEALAAVRDAVQNEVTVALPNPLVGPTGVHHHGQFLTQRLAAALDATRAAAYPVLTLSVARLAALQDPDLTGLPPFLASDDPGSSGLMITEYVATDLLARARILAEATTVARAVVSLGVEEHASFSTQAAWACRDLAELAPELIGCELVAARRALELAPARRPGGPLAGLLRLASSRWAHRAEDHVLGPELAAAAALVGELVGRAGGAPSDPRAASAHCV